jgi:hypothetical protein
VPRDVGTALLDTDGDENDDGFDVGAAKGGTDKAVGGTDDGLEVSAALGDTDESADGNEIGACEKTVGKLR